MTLSRWEFYNKYIEHENADQFQYVTWIAEIKPPKLKSQFFWVLKILLKKQIEGSTPGAMLDSTLLTAISPLYVNEM